MINAEATKSRIISFLEKRGPSLPIQIAKELGTNSIFASAFLSELLDDKKIKASSLKVGGTHIYLLGGQEAQLEKFYQYLHPKEAEAYLLLKENKILKDSEQEPAIRVALRAIKDFAFSFKNDEDAYWRYLSVSEPEIIEIFNSRVIKPKVKEQEKPEEPKIEIQDLKEKIVEEVLEKERIGEKKLKTRKKIKEPKEIQLENLKKEKQELIEFNNPLVEKPIQKPKKEKPKSEFVLKVINSIEKNNWKIIEEKKYKAKEYTCIVEINSELGKIQFYTQAKDKKTISDSDLKKLLSTSQSIPLPALILYTKDLSKKAKEYIEKYISILKAKKIE